MRSSAREMCVGSALRYLAALGLVVVSVPVLSGAVSANAQDRPEPAPLFEATELTEAREDFAARLKRPAAVARREASEMRFSEQSGREAREVGQSAFPGVLSGPVLDADSIDPDADSVSVLSETAAVVERDGARTVRVAALPVAAPKPGTDGSRPSELRPLDFSLTEQDGSFTPEVPSVETEIPVDAAEGNLVEGEYGLRLVDAAASDGVVDEDRVWFTNTAEDTDMVQFPVLGGVEVSLVLRSIDSPERFVFEIDAPRDAVIRESSGRDEAPPGSVVIVESGEVTARVFPPVIYDADGRQVPVSQVVRDRKLILEVAHRGNELRYPLHVDPVMAVPYPVGEGDSAWANWGFHSGPRQAFGGWNQSGPLYLYPRTGYIAYNGDQSQWRFTARPGTFVSGVHFFNFSHAHGPHGAYVGIANPANNAWEGGVGWQDSANNTGVSGSGGPWFHAFSGAIWDMCHLAPNTSAAQHICEGGQAPADQNHAIVGLTAQNPFYPAGHPWTQNGEGNFGMSNASVRLGDRSGPTEANFSAGTSEWRDDGGSQAAGATAPSTFSITAKTEGLGMRTGTLAVGGTTYQTATPHPLCSDPIREWCTPNASYRFDGVQLPEGESTVTATAWDLVYNGRSTSLTSRIDRTPPTGGMTVPGTVKPGTTQVSGTISDQRSGPKEWTVEARTAGSAGEWTTVCSVAYAAGAAKTQSPSCVWPASWSTRTGAYEVRARMADLIAPPPDAPAADRHRSATPSRTVTVLTGDDTEGDRLGLERWWAFETTETGAGSSLHVNGWNGNGVWHTPLIDNSGRGLDTSLSLTYNSRERRGFLASVVPASQVSDMGDDVLTALGTGYNEVGTGFSLGFDVGRLNEPLRGVQDLDAARISLTDADGTRHTFTRDGSGAYVEPPGVNLRLRKVASPSVERTWSMTKSDGSVRYFSQGGFMTSVVDRRGNTLRLEYERYSKVNGGRSACSQTNPLADPVPADLQILCAPRVRRIVDAAGADALDAAATSTDPAAIAAAEAIAARRSVVVTYANQALLASGAAQVVSQLPVARQRLMALFAGNAGRITKLTDHGGRVTEFGYADGWLTRLTQGDVATGGATDSQHRRTFSFEYEGSGNPARMTRIIDPRPQDNGAQPSTTAGTRVTYGSQACSTYGDPQAADRAARVIDRAGRATTFCYGQSGDATRFQASAPSVTTAAAATTAYDLDGRGRPTSVVDAIGRRTTTTWDDTTTNDNNVATMTRAVGTAEAAVDAWTYDRNGETMTQTDPLGRTTLYEYCHSRLGDAQPCGAAPDTGEIADLRKVTRPAGDSATFGRNAFGELTSRQYSGEAGLMRWVYDTKGRLLSETDEVGRRTDFEAHDESGLPQRIADGRATAAATGSAARSRRWVIGYDAVGNPTSQTDPRGATVGIDPNTPPTINSDYTVVTAYDAFDRPVRVETPRAVGTKTVRSTTYDDNGNVVSATDGNGKASTYAWTETDQLRTATTPPVTHNGGATSPEVTRWTYDAHDNVSLLETPNGVNTVSTTSDWSTEYAYDNVGQLEVESRRSTDGPLPRLTTSYAYDARGNVTGIADPQANLSGDPRATPRGAQRRWGFTYDLADNQTAAVEAPDVAGMALRTERSYDANDRLWKVRPPRWQGASAEARPQFETEILYDARDNRRSVARGDRVTRYGYFADGQVASIRSPRASSATDANFVTAFTYDAAGDLASRKLPSAGLGHETARKAMTYTRDAAGDPVTVKDYRGTTATNTFFLSGELKSTTRPWMWAVSPAADIDRDGPEVRERPWEQWRDGGRGGPAGDGGMPDGDFGVTRPRGMPPLEPRAGLTTFDYDGDMRLRSISDGASRVTTLARDDVGRVSSVVRPLRADRGGALTTTTKSYGYDHDGQTVSVTDAITDTRSTTTTTTFDQFGRRIQRTAPGAARSIPATGTDPADTTDTTRWTYDANDNVTARTAPTGAVTRYTYDRVDRRTSVQAPESRTTTFGYDKAGNATCLRRPEGNSATSATCAAGAFTTTSTYNPYDELSTQTVPNPEPEVGGATLEWSFDYNRDGDRTSVTEPGSRRAEGGSILPRTTRYRYDGRGLRWATTTFAGPSGEDPRTTITEHDPNGNLRRTVHPRGVDEGTDSPAPETADTTQTGSPSSGASTQAAVNVYSPDNLPTETWLPHADPIKDADGDGEPDADVEDRKRYRVVRSYDTRGRLRTISRPSQSGESAPRQATYGYLETGWIGCTSRETTVQGDCDNASGSVGLGNRLGGEIRYDYDKRGLQTGWTTAGRESTREYYDSGQLKRRSARVSETDPRTRTYRYAWTGNRQLAEIHDVQEERRWKVTRDTADRVTHVNETGAGDRDTAFTYHPQTDNVHTRRTDGVFTGTGTGTNRPYANGATATFSYDTLDRETQMVVEPRAGATRTIGTKWWPSGDRRTRDRAGRSSSESWFFDADGRRSRHQRTANGKDQAYDYDRNGNRTRDEQGSHTFNSRDQLVETVNDAGLTTKYTLDGSGSIRKRETVGQAVALYQYDRDRLTCVATFSSDPGANPAMCPANEAAALPSGQTGWAKNTYSPGLNQVQSTRTKRGTAAVETTRYGYDAFGRLTGQQQTDNGRITRYTHDGLDRRELKCNAPAATFGDSVTGDGFDRSCPGGALDRFSYLGLSEKLTSEQQSGSTGQSPHNERRLYDYDSRLERLGQDRVTAAGSGTYRGYGLDARGSVEILENADGSRAAAYRYGPYGDATVTNGANDQGDNAGGKNPFRFEGFYSDDGLGTYDMQARPYSPELQRFLVADEFEDADADAALESDVITQDRYAFAAGNPVGLIEADGHCPARAEGPGVCPSKTGSDTPERKARIDEVNRTIDATNARNQARDSTPTADAGGAPPSAGTVDAAQAPGGSGGGGGSRAEVAVDAYEREAERLLDGARATAAKDDSIGASDVAGALIGDDPLEAAIGLIPIVKGAKVLRLGSKAINGAKAGAVRAARVARLKDQAGALRATAARLSRAARGPHPAAKPVVGGAGPVRLGQAGEDAVRGAFNIGDKAPITVGTRTRIPDGITTSTVSEVKNVGSLSYSSQLRDYVSYAQQTGRQVDLYVRGGSAPTRLSGPLQDAIRDPSVPINLKFIP